MGQEPVNELRKITDFLTLVNTDETVREGWDDDFRSMMDNEFYFALCRRLLEQKQANTDEYRDLLKAALKQLMIVYKAELEGGRNIEIVRGLRFIANKAEPVYKWNVEKGTENEEPAPMEVEPAADVDEPMEDDGNQADTEDQPSITITNSEGKIVDERDVDIEM